MVIRIVSRNAEVQQVQQQTQQVQQQTQQVQQQTQQVQQQTEEVQQQAQQVQEQTQHQQRQTVTNPAQSNRNVPLFMKPNDVSTVDEAGAKEIGEFLGNKKLQNLRRAELTNYLLGQKDEQGNRVYTIDEAEDLAKNQVKNEKDQAKSKVTIPFIDKEAYEKFKEQLKAEGKEDLYKPTLIKNKHVLAMINGDNITDPAEKEANYKKWFMTDDNGNLIVGADGKYVFDPEKYKAEMVKDTDGYRLTLSGRAKHAEERNIPKRAEKDAVKAAGLGYRKDRTWLYRTLLIGAGVACAVFGGAVATAVAGASSTAGAVASGASAGAEAGALAKSSATNRLGQVVGAAGCLVAAAFVKDRDGKVDNRKEAQEVFENIEEPVDIPPVEDEEEVQEETVQEESGQEETVQEEECEETPCLTTKELPPEITTISTIRGGGPYHYAQLYVDENGKPYRIGTPEFRELQRKLSSGEYSIQTIDRKRRELRNSIPVGNGVARLADDADAKARKGFEDAQIEDGKGDRKYAKVKRNGRWVIVYCENGNPVPNTRTFASQQEAQDYITLITTPAK